MLHLEKPPLLQHYKWLSLRFLLHFYVVISFYIKTINLSVIYSSPSSEVWLQLLPRWVLKCSSPHPHLVTVEKQGPDLGSWCQRKDVGQSSLNASTSPGRLCRNHSAASMGIQTGLRERLRLMNYGSYTQGVLHSHEEKNWKSLTD